LIFNSSKFPIDNPNTKIKIKAGRWKILKFHKLKWLVKWWVQTWYDGQSY
jgi:hypothetical protein